ncbi:MAG: hypothetical protein E6J71_19490 [Deltaproteobacteria bacterium]|nr:MAG: hypothetical protein E6J71_19490 [Deltaproteobacteria bacterium]
MKAATLLLLLGATLLEGCCRRAVRWTRPGATEREFYAEYGTCEQETAPRWSFCTGLACVDQETAVRERWERCMRARGWAPHEHCRSRGEDAQTFGAE